MINYQYKINCTQVRGGTSKGVMFLEDNLPTDVTLRYDIIRKIMGVPDSYKNQTHGLGGGKSTNNKVGIIRKSTQSGIDIEYLFMQLNPNTEHIDTAPNCGNFISAVPVFAIFKDLVAITGNNTLVRILNLNTQQIIHAKLNTNQQGYITTGTTEISGVKGMFSEIELEFYNVVGSKTGKLFPLNERISKLESIQFSVIDVSVPMILIDGNSMNIL